MPVVTVQMWPGRTTEQKRALVKAITDAMVEHAKAKPEGLHVVLQEIPLENWGRAGVLGIDRVDLNKDEDKEEEGEGEEEEEGEGEEDEEDEEEGRRR